MTNYLEIDEVYVIYERMIKIGGGRGGVRDFTLLHSAVERPKATFAGKELYPNLWLKAAALINSLIKNHPFNDGNKRTGFFSMVRFLKINGYDVVAKKSEIISFVLSVDTKNLTLKKITDWIKRKAGKIK